MRCLVGKMFVNLGLDTRNRIAAYDTEIQEFFWAPVHVPGVASIPLPMEESIKDNIRRIGP